MLRNHFKTAWQNLRSHKSYVVINMIGLAVGIAACLLIFLLVHFETSFDNFHNNSDRIYRVVSEIKTNDGLKYSRGSAYPVAEALQTDYPELEHIARTYDRKDQHIIILSGNPGAPEKKFKENVLFAEPAFFSIFNFPFLAGNASTALYDVNTAVVSQTIAEKFFGDWHNAVGRLIKSGNGKVCKITGVLKNIPDNTDFPLQIVFSFKTSSEEDMGDDWSGQDGSLNTFVKLPENLSSSQFNNDLKSLVRKHAPAEFANHGYILQPLNAIHYDGRFGTLNGRTFSKELITALSMVGLFLLIIACINFINLATAQAVNRSKEVGIRKVLGSTKQGLIAQFLSETFIVTLIAVVVAIALAFIGLPLLNNLFNTSLEIQPGFPLFGFLSVVTIIVTLLSGFYPAIVLSGFNPITVLKNKLTSKAVGGLSLRRMLVVFQFAVAQAFIIATIVVVRQMDFFQNATVGFNKEAIVLVHLPNDSLRVAKMDGIKQRLLQQAGIKNVSLSLFSPMDEASWGGDFKFDNSTIKSDFNPDLKWADKDYFETYDIQFIAGAPYRPADSINGFVINEMMATKLGYKNPEKILGKKLDFSNGAMMAPVVGVVKDFNSSSLKQDMKPVVLGSWKLVFGMINIRIEPENARQTLAAIESVWSKTFPDFVFEYEFLDDKIAGFYKQESQLSQLFRIAAGIAIFISCLGLYGFVSFMAAQRTKEVGIRRVLGASVAGIMYLFMKEFTILIGISFVIATPVAWYLMHRWLEHFAYRTNIGFGVFLLTIFLSQLLAWITVVYQSIKVADTSPVKSLRS